MTERATLDSILRANNETGSPSGAQIPPTLPATMKKARNPRNNTFLFVIIGVGVPLAGILGVGIFVYGSLHGSIHYRSAQKTIKEAEMTAMEAASKPVQSSSTLASLKKKIEENRDFRIRQYLDGYQLRGEKNSHSDPQALEFLKDWIASHFNDEVCKSVHCLEEEASKLANDPSCTDPIILTCTGNVSVELHEAIHRLERALAEFPNSKHLAYPKYFATVILGKKLEDSKDRQPVLDAQALKFLKEAFADGSLKPADQEIIAESLILYWGAGFLNRNGNPVAQLLQAQGKEYEWLAFAVEGQNEINEAWRARGNGTSSV